jgi:hypothetical protein
MKYTRKDFMAAVGEVNAKWNEVEVGWYDLYCMMMSDTNKEKADAIYSKFRTAAQQRELIMAIGSVFLADFTELMLELKKQFELSNRIARKRNAVVHGRYTEGWDENDPSEPGVYIEADELGRPNEFAGLPLIPTLQELRGEIAQAFGELNALRLAISKTVPNVGYRGTFTDRLFRWHS